MFEYFKKSAFSIALKCLRIILYLLKENVSNYIICYFLTEYYGTRKKTIVEPLMKTKSSL